jgi:processive 1,2-diacylglycerol beta-glucosyltransferase
MVKKVLILSASSGYGHIRAAQAIEQAFAEMRPDVQVQHIDILDYSNRIFKAISSKTYIDMVNKSPRMSIILLNWLTNVCNRPWKNEKLWAVFYKLNCLPLISQINNYQPDLLINTHFVPARIISSLKEKKALHTPQVIVVTDFDVHSNWLCRQFGHYFVALKQTGMQVEQFGIPSEKITVSGIPIHPIFAQHKDKASMRAKYGLKQYRTTVLISSGGFGVGPMEHLVKSLFHLKHEAQVIVICGKHEGLKSRLESIIAQQTLDERVSFKVVGYTADMDEYMAAADILVGKAGALTISEALSKGLMMVITDPLPVWEEHNADLLVTAKAAIRCKNIPSLADQIDQLLDDPARQDLMQENVRRLARPRAAYDIVDTLLRV